MNIEDVVRANLLVMTDDRANDRVFNVGGGRGYTVREFADIVRQAFGKDLAAVVPGLYRYGDTRHIQSDISALQALGWTPRKTPRTACKPTGTICTSRSTSTTSWNMPSARCGS